MRSTSPDASMLLTVALLLTAILAGCHCRQVELTGRQASSLIRKLVTVADRVGARAIQEGNNALRSAAAAADLSTTIGDEPLDQLVRHLEEWSGDKFDVNQIESRSFTDLLPHVGSFIFRGAVRRVMIKPMIGGMKRLIPGSMKDFYYAKLANRRVVQLVEPMSPLISSYAYNKFEQGIFWGIKRSYQYVSDNFIESEEDENEDEEEEEGDSKRRRRRWLSIFPEKASINGH